MRNLLRKLHIVQDQYVETTATTSTSTTSSADGESLHRLEKKNLLGLPDWLSSVASKNPFANSFPPSLNIEMGRDAMVASSDAVVDAGVVESERNTIMPFTTESTSQDSALEQEEEYQLQRAIELSTREDPEAAQIEAVKQISLGSCSPQNSPAEVLAYRYWNYNALSFDDKILDDFYDLYGVLPETVTVKMPSLTDLQGVAVSDNIFWEAVLVNRSGDADLLKLEQKALVMALEYKSSSLHYAGKLLVQKIAIMVADYMGGAVEDSIDMFKAWMNYSKSLRMSFGNNVLPLGRLTVGLARHRALLFKVLADSVGVPCQLLKGKLYTGSDDGAMNIVRLTHGREWIVDLMTDPGTLISSDASGTHSEYDDNSSALSPSWGDGESSRVLSCSSSGSSSISCSSGNEASDKRSFVASENDKSTMGESQKEEKKKSISFPKESPSELPNNKLKVSNNLWKPHGQKVPSHDASLKSTHPYALARSPSWTEGISSPAVRRMKVKDVSQYMIDATKENPQLAKKLHDVLLESGVVVPHNLFNETDQEEASVSKHRNLSDHKNETKKRQPEVNPRTKFLGTLGLPLPCVPDRELHPKVAPSRPYMNHLNSVVGLGAQHPLDIGVSCPSQTEESPLQQQFSAIKLIDNMPVAAAVATAAIVASSMVVAAAKSNSDTNIDVPVAAAATATAAAVVATTAAVSMQHEQLLSHPPLPFISNCNHIESPQIKYEENPLTDGKKGSDNHQHCVPGRQQDTGVVHYEAERKSDKSEGSDCVKSDAPLEDVAEFEIPWEEIILGERIGLGSYGEVYRGDWHGTEVAVKKFLEQDLSGDALEEFKSEVRIMKRVRHPNVVLFMGAVTRVPNLSIITEFLPRGSLFRLIHRPNNHLDERRRLKMALDVARGMNYLHSCSPAIVHRDLKSPNLLVDKNWVVKVCDFGLSRIKHNTFLSSRSTAGTAEWMAPEVLRNEPSDEKCDVYSFGVILWELCTLQQPWGGMNPMQVVGAVGFQHRRLDIPDDMDPVIAGIILKCWQTNPAKRPSFSEIMAELKPLQRPMATAPAMRQRVASSNGTE